MNILHGRIKRPYHSWFVAVVGILCVLANAYYHIKAAGSSRVIIRAATGREVLDQYSQFLPVLTFGRKSFLAGTFPLWDPYQGLGQPVFAVNGYGFFNPIYWVGLILDVPYGMLVIQGLSVAIGMVGTICYMRYLKFGWAAVTLASAFFGFAVLMDSFNLCLGATHCWLPVTMLLAHRLFDRPSLRSCVAFTASLVLCFLGGFAQYFYYISIILFVYFFSLTAFDWLRSGHKAALVRLGLFGFAFLLTVGLISFQFFPTLELSLSSGRSINSEQNPMVMGFSLFNLLRKYLIVPQSSASVGYYGSSLLLIPFAILSKKRRTLALALLAVWAYMVLFVLSKQIPLLEIFGKIPFSGMFRFHMRILPLGNFMVAVLVGIGLSSFSEETVTKLWNTQPFKFKWALLLVTGFWCLILAFALGSLEHLRMPFTLILILPWGMALLFFLLRFSEFSFRVKACIVSASIILFLISMIEHREIYSAGYIRHIIISINALLVVILALLFMSIPTSLLWRTLGVWAVALVVLFDVVSNREHVQLTVPATTAAIVDNSESDARIGWVTGNAGYDRVLLTYPMSLFNPNVGSMFQFFNINSYDSFTQSRWRNYVEFMIGPETFSALLHGRSWYGIIKFVDGAFLSHPQMLGLTSLRYYVSKNKSPRLDEAWELSYEKNDEDSAFYVYENKHALPRVYVVDSYILSHSEEESLKAVRANISSLSGSVVLEGGAPSFPSAPTRQTRGKARIVNYGINEVILNVETARPSLVVLTDIYYPGWQAFVDGAKRPIWRANSLFRAVEIGPGEHTITFKYRPASLYWGLTVSLVTLALIVVGLILERIYARKRSANDKSCSEIHGG